MNLNYSALPGDNHLQNTGSLNSRGASQIVVRRIGSMDPLRYANATDTGPKDRLKFGRRKWRTQTLQELREFDRDANGIQKQPFTAAHWSHFKKVICFALDRGANDHNIRVPCHGFVGRSP